MLEGKTESFRACRLKMFLWYHFLPFTRIFIVFLFAWTLRIGPIGFFIFIQYVQISWPIVWNTRQFSWFYTASSSSESMAPSIWDSFIENHLAFGVLHAFWDWGVFAVTKLYGVFLLADGADDGMEAHFLLFCVEIVATFTILITFRFNFDIFIRIFLTFLFFYSFLIKKPLQNCHHHFQFLLLRSHPIHHRLYLIAFHSNFVLYCLLLCFGQMVRPF